MSRNFRRSFKDDFQPDLIIRSCDDVDFRVLKAILARASPFFRNMFELPGIHTMSPDSKSESSDNYVDGIPVMRVAETAQIWNDLLDSFIYPANRAPHFTSLEHAYTTARAARKYEMAEIERILKDVVGKFSENHALSVFALAVDIGWAVEMKRAARQFLKGEFNPLAKMPHSLQAIQAPVLYQLLQYRSQCAEAAMTPFNDLTWVVKEIPSRPGRVNRTSANFDYRGRFTEYPWAYIWLRCSSCTGDNVALKYGTDSRESVTPRVWWRQYIDDVKTALQKRPTGSVATETVRLEWSLSKAEECTTCGPLAFKDLMEFSKHLEERIDEAVSTVHFELPTENSFT